MVLSVATEKKSPVTPPEIDPETVRLVEQCLNHYATPRPKEAHNMTIHQWTIWLFTVHCQPKKWGKQLTFSETFNWTWFLCHTHSLITNPVSHPVSLQILCHTQGLITYPVSHPQTHQKSCATPTVSSQILCHSHSLITNPVTLTV